jgi:hypothetical protein
MGELGIPKHLQGLSTALRFGRVDEGLGGGGRRVNGEGKHRFSASLRITDPSRLGSLRDGLSLLGRRRRCERRYSLFNDPDYAQEVEVA